MLVHVVQLIGAAEIAADAARDHDHRDPVEKGLADAARGVRDARGRDDQQRTDTGTGPADRIRHESAAALVRDEHGRDRFRRAHLIVELGVVYARYAERVANAELLERVARERRRCLCACCLPGSAA